MASRMSLDCVGNVKRYFFLPSSSAGAVAGAAWRANTTCARQMPEKVGTARQQSARQIVAVRAYRRRAPSLADELDLITRTPAVHDWTRDAANRPLVPFDLLEIRSCPRAKGK